MMSNNKILTVSYGTFSCTLEGFDDSFGTMKAIAEYFRDLASDDRYFGAEPPQPDAEMLTRIAQKEISRRVEAREHEGKIVLSAMADTIADAPRTLSGAIADTAAVATEAPVTAGSNAHEAPRDDNAIAPDIADTTAIADDVTQTQAAIAEPEPETATADVAAEEVDSDVVESADDVGTEPEVDVLQTEETDGPDIAASEDAVEAFFADSPSLDIADAESFEDDILPPTEPARDESIAAKLQRIRAVVAQQADDEEDEDYLEDEHADVAQTADATARDLVADAHHDIEAALHSDDEDLMAEDDQENDDDDVAAILSRLDQANAEEIAEAQDDDAFYADELEDAGEDEAASVSEPQDVAVGDYDDETSENLFGADESEDDISDADATGPRGRVIKVKRADLEAAIAKGELEEYDDEDTADGSQTAAQSDVSADDKRETTLSDEDEAELARELASLEADSQVDDPAFDDAAFEDADDAAEADDEMVQTDDIAAAKENSLQADDAETPDDMPAAATARDSLPKIDDVRSADMSRLLAETDQQMDEPESATRRDAFAHLRAAVAAKKADEAMGAKAESEENDNAYRNDLADVVRPRRPVASGDNATRTARPAEPRPAPLKLVAEQRIDIDRPRHAGPVRPRRVAAVADPVDVSADAESFADYAAEMGATKLPQLLEAAAAYMSFVEGREQFSRPQLMGKVRQVGHEDFSREDGLRSFGQLLRAGKIEKIKGGRFTVSEDIGFRPDHRAAG